MADLGTQALGAVFEPIKDRMKKVPVPVVVAFLVAYLLPWTRFRLACYRVAQDHPGALFYSLLIGLVLSIGLVIALVAWRKERRRRRFISNRLTEEMAKPNLCHDPAHSWDELAFYDKVPHGGVLWDVRILGHKGPRPEVHDIRIPGQAAYCPKCVTTPLMRQSNSDKSWWSCPTCKLNRPCIANFDGITAGVRAVAFAQFKKQNPTAINNRG